LGTVHLTDVIRGLLEDALSLTKNELDARHRQFNLMCALSHVSASFNVFVYVFVVEKEGGEGRKEGRKGDGGCVWSEPSLTHSRTLFSLAARTFCNRFGFWNRTERFGADRAAYLSVSNMFFSFKSTYQSLCRSEKDLSRSSDARHERPIQTNLDKIA
jgi:hypothetical protein